MTLLFIVNHGTFETVISKIGRIRNYCKCELGTKEIVCLGHIVGGGNIKPDPSKIKAMAEYPLPVPKKDLKCFLGMIGYYRRFIQHFSKIASSLTEMLKKGKPNRLQWTEPFVSAFQTLRSTLLSKPILITPNFDLPFIVQTDASNRTIGAVLSQDISDVEHPIAFLSRKLLPPEQNYSTVEKECLAIVWAIHSLKYYLSGHTFTIETDHDPLTPLTQMKDKNQRLLRWLLTLQQYDRSGNKNTNSDAKLINSS